jgi:hypothetical protein
MKPAASRVNTITANAIVVVFSALMIAISGCAGLGNATATAPEMKMTTDIPESIVMPDKIKTRIGTLELFDGFPNEETVQKAYDSQRCAGEHVLDAHRLRQRNLIPDPDWFVYLRLYGPEKAYFDKTWIPGDAEKVK